MFFYTEEKVLPTFGKVLQSALLMRWWWLLHLLSMAGGKVRLYFSFLIPITPKVCHFFTLHLSSPSPHLFFLCTFKTFALSFLHIVFQSMSTNKMVPLPFSLYSFYMTVTCFPFFFSSCTRSLPFHSDIKNWQYAGATMVPLRKFKNHLLFLHLWCTTRKAT